MTFEPFQSALDKAANAYGISREFRAIKVCKTFESLIPALFGAGENTENASKSAEAQEILTQNSFKDNILTINVPASIWASELMMKKEVILALLNERLQNDPSKIKVKDLRTKIV